MKRYEQIKKFIGRRFLGQRPENDSVNFHKVQADAQSLRNTLSTTGWVKLSDRLSESFVDGLHELFVRMRDGNYDKDKLLVQAGIVLARLELINTLDLMLEDGRIATEELKKQAEALNIEELAAET